MDAQTIVYALVNFAHDLFTAIWVGGLLVFALTVIPSARSALGAGPQTRKLMDTLQKRQSWLALVSMAGLVLTGLLQARRAADFAGLFSWANPYSAVLSLKHLLFVGMVAIALIRRFALRTSEDQPNPKGEKTKAILLYVNAGLGVLVLLLSGFNAALAG